MPDAGLLYQDIIQRLSNDIPELKRNVLFEDEVEESKEMGAPGILVIDDGDENAEHGGGQLLTFAFSLAIVAPSFSKKTFAESAIGSVGERTKGVLQYWKDCYDLFNNFREWTPGNNGVLTLYVGSDPTVHGETESGERRSLKVMHWIVRIA